MDQRRAETQMQALFVDTTDSCPCQPTPRTPLTATYDSQLPMLSTIWRGVVGGGGKQVGHRTQQWWASLPAATGMQASCVLAIRLVGTASHTRCNNSPLPPTAAESAGCPPAHGHNRKSRCCWPLPPRPARDQTCCLLQAGQLQTPAPAEMLRQRPAWLRRRCRRRQPLVSRRSCALNCSDPERLLCCGD